MHTKSDESNASPSFCSIHIGLHSTTEVQSSGALGHSSVETNVNLGPHRCCDELSDSHFIQRASFVNNNVSSAVSDNAFPCSQAQKGHFSVTFVNEATRAFMRRWARIWRHGLIRALHSCLLFACICVCSLARFSGDQMIILVSTCLAGFAALSLSLMCCSLYLVGN